MTYPFWQVQDKVPSSVIKSFTNMCNKSNCRISFRMEETTLLGTSDYYDKDGNLIIEDRNQFSGKISCSKCWAGSKIDNNGVLTDYTKPEVD